MKFSRKTLSSLMIMATSATFAAEPAQAAVDMVQRTPLEIAALAAGAAITMAVSVLGAGAAVGRIGSAAMGAAAEKPELLTKSIIFVALAEGLAVLGFVIAIMLAQKII